MSKSKKRQGVRIMGGPAGKARFLEAYARLGVIVAAAAEAGIHRQSVGEWRRKDPQFEADFQEAGTVAAEHLLSEARRRAESGVAEPVFYQGKPVGAVRKYSDTLLIFLLKGLMPETFRERLDARVSGGDGGPLRIVEEIVIERQG